MDTQEEKHPGGRPSEYTKEAVVKAWDYIARYSELGDIIPTIEGLAIHIGVARKTLYNWAEDPEKEEFLHIFELCMAKQGKILVNNGLNGTFNSTISKLMLSKHGYVEKSEVDATSKGEKLGDGLSEKEKTALLSLLKPNDKSGSTKQGDGGDTRAAEISV